MRFPFIIQYALPFEKQLGTAQKTTALQFIQNYLSKKITEDIVLENNKLCFQLVFFNWNRDGKDIFALIDKGEFAINDESHKTVLSYTFYMHNLFISTFIMAVIMGISVQVISNEIDMAVFVSIICFLWLCGANWLTAIIRHKKMLKIIVKEIDILLKNT
jgi:hypothetical protein